MLKVCMSISLGFVMISLSVSAGKSGFCSSLMFEPFDIVAFRRGATDGTPRSNLAGGAEPNFAGRRLLLAIAGGELTSRVFQSNDMHPERPV
jgi:hypothetical protein